MTNTLDLEKISLKVGSHESIEDGMCVMEAVSFIAGEPWTDSPQCASPVIAAFLRSYNDLVDDEKRQSLKQYIPSLIGTRGSDALENRRALIAADWLVRTHTPAWLRLAGLTVQADALSSLPEITSLAQIPSIKGPLWPPLGPPLERHSSQRLTCCRRMSRNSSSACSRLGRRHDQAFSL